MKTWEWMCKFSGEVSPLRYLQVNRKHLGISHVPSNAMDHSLQVDLQCLRGGKGLPDPARVALKKPTNGPTNRQPSENLKRCSITIFLLEYPCRCAKQKPWFLSKKNMEKGLCQGGRYGLKSEDEGLDEANFRHGNKPRSCNRTSRWVKHSMWHSCPMPFNAAFWLTTGR